MSGHMDKSWGAREFFQRKDRHDRDHRFRSRSRRSRRQDGSLSPLRLVLQQLEERLLLTNQPNLVITASSAPTSAIEGNTAAISISWTVKNQGTAPATGDWNDAVYLSSSGTIDKNSAYVDSLDEAFRGPLAVGASYTVNRVVTLPEFAAGSQFLVFSPDDGNALNESSTSRTTSRAITVNTPNVDLAVTGATLSTSTVVGGDGQQVNVTWTTQNKGTDPAATGWTDAVYVSTKQALDSTATRLAFGDGPKSLPLAAGANYTSHATLTVPDLSAGQYFLIFATNIDATQGESDQASESNDTLAKPLTVTSPGNVDLALSGVTVNGSTSQQSAIEGDNQTVSVAYTVSNLGSVTAASKWTDGVYLSSKNSLDSSATLLQSLSPPSPSGFLGLPLHAGASYANQAAVTIPQWATGTQYLLVETDNQDVQSETSKTNNVVAVPITLTAPNVDLTVTNATASASTALVGDGATVKVTYTVQNNGTDAARGNWEDAIYLSTAQALSGSARLLDTIYQYGGANTVPVTLPAGASYTVTDTVTIPDFAPLGSDYLVVDTNAYSGNNNEQAETNLTNNTFAMPITLSAPAANLAVTTAQGTPATVEAGNGQQLNLSWNVTNNGTAAAGSAWNDNVLLAKDPNYDPSAEELFGRNGIGESNLAAGGSYTLSPTATVPNLPAGNMDLVFVTNQFDNQSETQKTDNVVTQPVTLTAPNVNLTISGQAPSTAIEGDSIPVTWTVSNTGSEAAKGTWSDGVYLSNDPVLDDTAVRLTSVSAAADAPLAASTGNYKQTANVTIPATTTGQHYLLFVTNDGQTQGETNYGDDVSVVPITLSAPDLSLTSATAPTASPIIEGGQTTVSWGVQNVGAVAAPAQWYDAVYVSDQPYFDSTTKSVGEFSERTHAGLAAAASYTDNETINLPQFPTGTAYLLFVTDVNSDQPQSDATGNLPDANDVKAVQVTLAAPDLSVTAATAPTSTIVEGVSIPVSWTVQNLSATTPAPATWYDSVYVSSKPTFDASAVYITDFSESSHIGLASNAGYTDNESLSVPQFPTGTAYLLFVTDYTRFGVPGQPQSDSNGGAPDANDVKAVQVTLAAPDLSVTAATAPTSAIDEGAKINVSWTVQNISASTPAPATWYDSVWVSSRPTFDSSAVYITDFSESSHSPLAAGGNYTDNEQISVPQFPVGSAYLLFITDYAQFGTAGQPQSDGATVPDANDVKAVAITLTAPDLQLTGATAPTTAIEGAPISVSWSVKNNGTVAADATWSDSVYVSSKNTFDSSAKLIKSFNESQHSPLAGGGNYTDNEMISVPQFATGSQFLLFVANYTYYAQQPESDGGNPPDPNDVFVLPITLSAPDLAVTAATAPTTPITEGASIPVSWTVKNQGNVAAPATWSDSVYVSSKQTFDSSAVFLQSFDESSHSGLAAGSTYTDTESVAVPQFFTGSQYLLFVADYTQYDTPGQPQSDSNNGAPDANDVKAVQVTLQAPDLQVTTASAPSTAVVGNGQSIAVSYTVKNISTTTDAVKTWTDAIYASDKPTFDSSDPSQQQLNVFDSQGPLAAGASYTVKQNVTLDNIGTKDTYLLFVTNVYGYQPESDAASPFYSYSYVPPANDVKAVSITFTEPAVSLQLTASTLPTSNATLVAGDDVPVSFTIKNAGSVAASGNWSDEVFYSQKSTYDSSAIELDSDSAPIVPLAAGASYTESRTVALGGTSSRLPLGPGYLLFTTNLDQSQGQTSYTNNLKAVPITIAAADLAVTAASAPATAVAGNGGTIAVSYTVKNEGSVNADSTWTDKLYISDQQTFDASDPNQILVGTLDSSPDALKPNDSYTHSTTVTLPAVPAGAHYLLFVANADGGQRESDELPRQYYYSPYTPDANDVEAAPITTSVPNVDLAISNPSAASTSLALGQSVKVSFAVTNNGTDTAAAAWTDAVYLSPTPTVASNAIQLTSINAPGTLAHGGNYTFSQTVTIPSYASVGSEYLVLVTNDNGAQAETDGVGGNDIANIPVTVSAAPPSQVDLKTTAIGLVGNPTTVNSNGTLNVTWTVENQGTAAATGSWSDYLYLSPTPTFNSSTAVSLGNFSEGGGSSGLAPQATYSDTKQVTVPESTIAGTYYVLVYANEYRNLSEIDNQIYGTTDTNNIMATGSITVQSADLKVTTATVNGGSSATAAAGNGVSLSVSYTVKNIGSVTATGSWEDELFISSKPTYDATAQYLEYFPSYDVVGYPNTQYTPLAAGSSYTIDDTASLDLSSLGSDSAPGQYYLLFVANAGTTYNYTTGASMRELGESDGGGGIYGDTNDVFSVPLTLTAPNVDLAISSPSTPSTMAEGQSYPVSFNVTNTGSDTASASWTDAVYFSYKPTLDSSAKRLADLTAPNALPHNSNYTFNANVTIPSDVAPAGGYLLLVTNDNGAQSETNTANDLVALPVTVAAADLQVTALTAPTSGVLNGTVQISWTVKNIGSVAAATHGWQDAVYLSSQPSLPIDTNGYFGSYGYLTYFSEASTGLAAGATYSDTQTITIPSNERTGDLYLIVVADAFGDQGDTNRLNNYYAVPIHITVPNADLTVTSVNPPASAILGQSINISWTVKNQGTLAANAQWLDNVYLSTKSTLDSSAVLLSQFGAPPAANSPLAAGSSYTLTKSLTVPQFATGSDYILVDTNANLAQSETDYTNDVTSAPITLASPDLTVTAATANGLTSNITAALGQTIPVTWTVKNVGSALAPAQWDDAVFISSKSTFDNTAKQIASFSESTHQNLAAGSSYSDSQSITIPQFPLGQQYLFFVTNALDQQPETNYSNNAYMLPITLAAPDLTLSTATAPAAATLGDSFKVSWTVVNQGPVAALSTWSDAVYVSNVDVLDGTAARVAKFDESSHKGLAALSGAPNNKYTDTESITLPSGNIGGRYLLFVTNYNQTQPESDAANDTNNVFAVPITVTGADLAVTSPTAPGIAAVGATIPVTWKTVNQGNATADAQWTDAIYFSKKSFLDSSALQVASYSEATHSPLAAGASYNESRQIIIPNSAAGDTYLLIVTNNNAAQAESNLVNDVVALPIELASVDLAAASIGGPATANFGDTVNVSWTVNTSSNLPIQAPFSDSIYLSTKSTFDASATLLTTVNEKSIEPIAANAGYTQTAQVTIPLTAASAAGTEYLYVVVNSGNQIVETNLNNNIVSTPIALSLPALPNLVPTNITIPATGLTGQNFIVTWTDQNNGNATATGPWQDYVWISANKTLDSTAQFLGQFTYPDSLDPGQSAVRSQSFNLPGAAGTYYVIVRADADGAINEGPNAANATVTSSTSITVAATPLPDLVVTSITQPTSGVLSGSTVPVTFTVKNEGNAATEVPLWNDAVFVSQLSNIQLTGDRLLDAQKMLDQPLGVPYFPQNASALNPGQSYQETINIALPVAASGTWYVYVVSDQTFTHTPLDNFIDPGPVRESNYLNNLTVSSPFTITQAPLPDLATTSVQAPSQVFSGQTTTVTWSVTNQGTGIAIGQPAPGGFAPVQPKVPATPAESTWQELVYMSTSQSIDSSAILLDTYTHDGALLPGNSYTESDTVRLPVGVSGKYYFIVQTNWDNQVFEGAATANDTLASSTASTVNLTPPPELDVTTLVAPATALASHQLMVNYTVTNDGPGATPIDPTTNEVQWTDTVYLSPTTTLDPKTEIKLGDLKHEGPLAAGGAYSQTASFTLANGLSGTFFVIVVADSGDAVFQVNRAGGTVAAANSTVISSKPAQLVVTSFTAPSAADPGEVVPMSWTVTNQGTGDTAVTFWVDKVYAATTSTLGTNRVLVGTFPHTGLLNAGGTYTDNELVTIPFTITGQYNLFVYTNAPVTTQEDGQAAQVSPPGGWVYELNPAASVSAPSPITFSSKLADLQVPTVTVTPVVGANVETGGYVTVNYTVQNDGTATTSSTHWYDDVYLSPTPTFNAQTAVYLGSYYDDNPLAVGAKVNDSAEVLVPPSLAAGNYYFLVLADRPVAPPPSANIPNVQQTVNLVAEGNENNNTGASAQTAVSLGPTPDLTTAITTAPTSTVVGDDIQVDWTVTNKGVDTLPMNTIWYDEVYLSLDTTLDESSIPIGSVAHLGGLPGTESAKNSYSASDFLQLPAGLTGNYYIIVEADVQGSVFQSKPSDKIAVSAQPLDISLTPPIDLVAGTVTVPANAVPGEPMMVTYRVTNNSVNANPGDWYDSLYLSTTTSWQLSNPLFDRVLHTGGVAANGQYSETVTAPLPGVTPGTYYLILRTNIYDEVPETNTTNNLSASSQISLAVPSITPGTPSAPGTPATGSLTQGGSAYYQVTVAAGQTLQLTLTDTAANDVNGLYVGFGHMPSPSQYDFAGSQTLVADQTTTIPATEAGTYYIDVANNIVYGYNAQTNPNVTANYSLSATIIPFSVTAVTPNSVGNAGSATIEISGAKFDRDTTFQLIDPKGNVINASSVDVTDGATAYATFNLAGATLGSYSVQATADAGGTTELAAGLTVVAGAGPQFADSISGPGRVRLDREASFNILYGNNGDADAPAPLITVISPFNNPISAVSGGEAVGDIILLATSPDGPAGSLRPGEQTSVPIFFTSGSTSDPYGFQISTITTTDTTPMDWGLVLQNWIPPNDTSLPNWNAIYTQLQQQVGPTWGDFVQMLDRNANLLPAVQAGNPTDDVEVEIAKAEAAVSTSISGKIDAADLSIPVNTNEYVDATNTTTGDSFAAQIYQDGSFSFSNLTPGAYNLTVEFALVAAGGALSVTAGQAVRGWQLTLDRGTDVTGVATVAGTSAPLASANIRAIASDGTTYSTVSDANGDFSLTGLAGGTYEFVADATGFARVVLPSVTVGASDLTQDLSFSPEATIGGTVAIPTSDLGNIDVIVQPTGNTDPNQLFETTTNTTTFVVHSLPPGTYDVTVSTNGYLPTTVSSVVVTTGGTVNVGTVQLSKPASISGTLTSDDPQSLASGVDVELLQGSAAVAEAQTDSNGAFTFSDLPAGSYTVHALLQTGIAADTTVSVIAAQALSGVSITIEPGGTITGTLTDATTGSALAGLPVMLLETNGTTIPTATDSNGNYQFANLPVGSYSVYLPSSSATAPQSINIGGLTVTDTANFSVSLPYQTSISGHVDDSQGSPLANAGISLIESGQVLTSGVTAADGSYSFLLNGGGTFDLLVSSDQAGIAPATSISIATGSHATQNFTAGDATLTVSVSDTSAAVTGDIVELYLQTADGNVLAGSQFPDANGNLTFSDLAAGTYTVSARGNERGGSTGVTITAGATANASLTLSGLFDVNGTISDSLGNPVAGAQVTLFSPTNASDSQTATTAADGSFDLSDTLSGTYDLVVVANGFQAKVQSGISVSANATINTSLVASNSSVSGTVVDGSGNHVPGAFVFVLDSAGHAIGEATTAANGNFTITSATGTNLTVQVSAAGALVKQVTNVTVSSGGSVQLGQIAVQLLATDPGGGSGGGYSIPNVSFVGGPLLTILAGIPDFVQGLSEFGPLQPPDPNCPGCESQYATATAMRNAANYSLDNSVRPSGDELGKEAFGVVGIATLETAKLAGTLAGIALAVIELVPLSEIGAELAEAEEATAWMNGFGYASEEASEAVLKLAEEIEASSKIAQILDLVRSVIDSFNQFTQTETPEDASKAAAKIASIFGDIASATIGLANLLAKDTFPPAFGLLLSAFNLVKENPWENTIKKWEEAAQAYEDFQNSLKIWNQQVDRANQATDAYYKCLSSTTEDCNKDVPKFPLPIPLPGGGIIIWPVPIPGFPFGAFDPNEMIGPAGYGDQQFVPANQPLNYTIDFENESTATAPAQEVTITEQLDPNINPDSFRLGNFGWGGQTFSPPPNSSYYQTTIDETATLGILVQVTATIDVTTDTATWDFLSIDPATGQKPADPSKGFLPPDNASQAGEGFVSYTVLPNANVKTGAVIYAQATVVFDSNAPINTNQVFNTIDTGGSLGSAITGLPTNEPSTQFTVSWAPANEDKNASGIASYTVYVSDNGGPFTPFIENTTSTSATFTGQKGHTYKFYSLATDTAGNQQSPASATTLTTTVGDIVTSTTATSLTTTEGANLATTVAKFTGSDPGGVTSDFTATINWGDGTSATTGNVSGTAAGGYSVTGLHTYAEAAASRTITVIITDIGGTHTVTSTVTVDDATLTGTALSLQATEGVTFSGAVTKFSDANAAAHLSDFTATINWGDGSPMTTGQVTTAAGGGFSINASHVYAEEGTHNVTVSIVDVGGSKLTVTGTATVSDATLSGTALSVSATEGITFSGALAKFSDLNPSAPLSDFTATVNWGDGSSATTGQVTTAAGGGFVVNASYLYAEEGTHSVTVSVADVGGTKVTITSTAIVSDATLTGAALSISSTEGATFSGAVANFSDAKPAAPLSDFTATVNWGDGSSATIGQVTTAASGGFVVNATHLYAHEGTHSVTVSIADVGGSKLTVTGTATVADATLSGTAATLAATAGVTISGTVATFTDANPDGVATDFTATVDWGDGISSTAANVTAAASGGFAVNASHLYAQQGTDTIIVTINDVGGAHTTVTSTAHVTATPAPTANPDTFVLGPNGPYTGSGATSVLANDVSNDGQAQNLVATLLSSTTNGTLTLHADGSFVYMPGTSFQGIDRFTYQVSEDGTTGNTVTVTLLSYNASLVDKLYQQVLRRSAEDSGLIYWTAQLDAGQPLDVVATGIFNSTERLKPLVTQFYEQYLNRDTDPSGLNYWVTDWQTKGDPRDVVENILSSQEFFDDAGDTNSGYVTLLYQRVLQRAAEPSGLSYWVGLMSSPTNETRFQIASQFYDTHEKHVDLVDFLFGEYFQGATPLPDTTPYVTDLDNGETETQVEKAIIDSSAYSSNPPEPATGSVGRALYPH